MTLYDLPFNRTGIVSNLNCNDNIKRRLLDLGFIKGTKVKPILKSPAGDPIAYEVRKTIIALRKEDCKLIDILREKNEK